MPLPCFLSLCHTSIHAYIESRQQACMHASDMSDRLARQGKRHVCMPMHQTCLIGSLALLLVKSLLRNTTFV